MRSGKSGKLVDHPWTLPSEIAFWTAEIGPLDSPPSPALELRIEG